MWVGIIKSLVLCIQMNIKKLMKLRSSLKNLRFKNFKLGSKKKQQNKAEDSGII